MVRVDKDGFIDCGDCLEYQAETDGKASKKAVIEAVRKAFIERFEQFDRETTATQTSDGKWTVKVYL